ncbi:MAG: hypothetical protein JWN17_2136 [Frankiales bacterium]|nr:hypothetical protein [Frankiales bacterium]
MTRLRTASPYLLGALLGTAGVLHFATPAFFDQIVPTVLPHPRLWTYASGVAELGVSALVLNPGTRQRGGLVAAGLFVAVFPANVQQALASHGTEQVLALLRLPVQVPLVLWGLQVWRARA